MYFRDFEVGNHFSFDEKCFRKIETIKAGDMAWNAICLQSLNNNEIGKCFWFDHYLVGLKPVKTILKFEEITE